MEDEFEEPQRTVGAAALSRKQSVYAAVNDTNFPMEVRYAEDVRNWEVHTICDRTLATFEVASLRFQAKERERIAAERGPAEAAASGYPGGPEVDRAEAALTF
ncbi:hypothetical protein [Mycobacteroides chelonae]|uniref:hypothetical protein n=1 Tax=Mycobacteroides chelonae TaxID=1774 RepID=UPI000993ADD8|nr:hypothetical protein [Mycobacteroides chelonae]